MPEQKPQRTYLFENNAAETSKIDSEALAIDAHEQYLDQLYRQYNIEVNHAILFYISDEVEPVIFVDKGEINIGRGDHMGHIAPELDLENYNGRELGVSRLHAQIIFDGENYIIQDLHSTNYTWLNGRKLVPYQPYKINDGAGLQFGRLGMTAFVIQRS